MRLRTILASLLGLQLAAGVAAAADAYVVIVHPSNAVTTMEKPEASRLFLKKVSRWPNGNPVEAVDLPETSPVREAFSKEVLGKSAGAVAAFWQQQIFAGRDVPPVMKADDAEVVAYVASHANAIGYVSPAFVTKAVRILAIKRQ